MQIGNLENGRTLNPRRATRERLAKAFELEIPAAVAAESEREVADHGLESLMKFDPYDENNLPKVAGVYVFYDISNRPVYVGMSHNQPIRDRVREHYEKFWFKRPIVDQATYVEIQDEKLGAQVGQILVHFLRANTVLAQRWVDAHG